MDSSEQAVAACRGTTLIEMVIALGILTVILSAMLGFLQFQGRITTTESSEVDIQSHLRRGIEDLCAEFTDAQLTGLDSNGLWATYMLPKKGKSGFPIPGPDNTAGAGSPNSPPFACSYSYGAQDFSGNWYPGGFYKLEFIDSVLPNDTVVESVIRTDLNKDGDMGDSYVFGQFRQSVYDSLSVSDKTRSPRAFRDFTWRCARMSVNGGAYTGGGNGFFYLRNDLSQNNDQRTDTFTDLNGDNVYEQPETFTDTNASGTMDLGDKLLNDYNLNGKYDERDSYTPFVDNNNNNVFDTADVMQAVKPHYGLDGSWTYYDACLRIRLMYIDRTAIPYTLRVAQTRVHIRNQLVPSSP